MTPAWLIQLMSRPKIAWGWNLTEEERICIDFADRMRVHTLEGRYRGIWQHIPNEGKRHMIVAVILKAMGMIPGASDYLFAGNWGSGVIEFKLPERSKPSPKTGKPLKVAATEQNDNQRRYQLWCERGNIPYAVCRSADEAEAMLREWGAL